MIHEKAREQDDKSARKLVHGPRHTFKPRYLRWYICVLLCLGVVVNYIDRQAFSILAPRLQQEIGWSEIDYGRIVVAFQISYAVMMMLMGRILDRIGTKLGYAVAVVWWSLAEMGHALAKTPLGFGAARFLLGVGEAGSYPASVKAIGEWFPKSERALATGIFNAAPFLGAIGAPVLVTLLAASYGWRGAFIGTGALGGIWLIAWLAIYDKPEVHKRLTPEEWKVIRPEQKTDESPGVSWIRLLGYRQLWAYAVTRILTDPVYWFFLYWLPKFLAQNHGIAGTRMIPYLTTVYLISGVGSIIGGQLSSSLVNRNWSLNLARKTAMGACALVMPIVILAAETGSTWLSVILIGVGLGAHQGWSSNNYALVLDLFPGKAVGSVFGIGGFLAGFSSVLAAEYTGRILDKDPSFYLPMFIFAGGIYIVNLAVVQLLIPSSDPAEIR